MYAVIETGGKQYKVQYGDVIFVEKLAAAEDEQVTFQVVALGGEENYGFHLQAEEEREAQNGASPAVYEGSD